MDFDSVVVCSDSSDILQRIEKTCATSHRKFLALPKAVTTSHADALQCWLKEKALLRPLLVSDSAEIPSELWGLFFEGTCTPNEFLNEKQNEAFPVRKRPFEKNKKNILFLYDHLSTHVQTIADHLEAFRDFSRHQVQFAAATRNARPNIDLKYYDVVVVHFSVRLSLESYISPHVADALSNYCGLKILFAQDEFDTAEIARQWMDRLRFHRVYTIIPAGSLQTVYPSERFGRTEFVPILAGYIPNSLLKMKTQPTMQRPIVVGYRGRDLPYWYGALGQEKKTIGVKMKSICEQKQISSDIEWHDSQRIYGPDWFEFLGRCRAMIGCEGGSNIFDEFGTIRQAIEKALLIEPNLSFEKAFETILAPHEGRIITNQITPKFFEAIALRTALILFEGEYSGVLKPNEHYIPLKKDFSNIEEVLEKLDDAATITKIVDKAYQDVVLSGRYSYETFVREFDLYIDSACTNPGSHSIFLQAAGVVDLKRKSFTSFGVFDASKPSDTLFSYFRIPHTVQSDWFPTDASHTVVQREEPSTRELFLFLKSKLVRRISNIMKLLKLRAQTDV